MSFKNNDGSSGEAEIFTNTFRAGCTIPVRATTSEIGISGGNPYPLLLKESATMLATTPLQNFPKFEYRFLVLPHADMATKPCCVSVKVSTELEARCILAPHFILFFAA
ncbi:host cell division inhibitor Icd-like protein [Photorhabdus aballayi]|uniref:host cell division inhibitor Icd-like protein n=1 Tax=Photorhabdus aballayi TaxID=2991723 RepID=UPI0035D53B59